MGQSLSKKREANGSDHIRSEAQTGRSASKQQSPLPGGEAISGSEVNGHPSNAEGSTELHLGTLTNPSTGSSEANKLNIEKTSSFSESTSAFDHQKLTDPIRTHTQYSISSDGTTCRLLKMENHFEVVQCLNNLSKQDLMKLGGALGLSYPKLRNMEPLLEEMVCAWLNKEDNVLQIGKPSWEGLKLALHKIGQEGVVNTITQVSSGNLLSASIASSCMPDHAGSDKKAVTSPSSSVRLTNTSTQILPLSPVPRSPEDVFPPPSGEVEEGDSTTAKERFPFLMGEHLSTEERNRLEGRLIMDSRNIRDEFASLLFETSGSLTSQKVPIDSLEILLKAYKIPELSECNKVSKMFSKAMDHCWFFSFRILKKIIDKCGTSDDKNRLAEYESNFKEYCKRRLREVPMDIINPAEKNKGMKFCVKTDKVFNIPAGEIYELQNELSNILGKPVYLNGIEDGCVKLDFYVLHELDEIFPLNEEQMDQLGGLGVVRVYDELHEYYDSEAKPQLQEELLSEYQWDKYRRDRNMIEERSPILEFPLELKWSRCSDMPFEMDEYIQSVVIEEIVYVGGGSGRDENDRYTVLQYDSQSGEWSKLLPYLTYNFGMTVARNQLVLVGGESDGYCSRFLGVWDTKILDWTHPYRDMKEARAESSVVTFNEWLCVAGGRDPGLHNVPLVEIMNSDYNEWYTAAPIPVELTGMKTAIVGDTWYLMGGLKEDDFTDDVYSVFLPDLISQIDSKNTAEKGNIWRKISGLGLHSSTPFSFGGSLLALGGKDNNTLAAVSTIHQYTSATGIWMEVGDLPLPWYDFTCVKSINNDIFVAGGYCHGNMTKITLCMSENT